MKLNVYAYGVKALYGSKDGKHFEELFDGSILIFNAYSYIHYWIDDKLQYHECIKDFGDIPDCGWIQNNHLKVELFEPRDYKISYK